MEHKKARFRTGTFCSDGLCSNRAGKDTTSRLPGRQFVRFFVFPRTLKCGKSGVGGLEGMLNSLHRQMSRGYAVTTSLMRTLMLLHFSDLHRTRTPSLSCCLMLFQSQIDIQLEAVCCNDNPDVMSRLENSGACITDNIIFDHITSEEGIEYSRALEGANIH